MHGNAGSIYAKEIVIGVIGVTLSNLTSLVWLFEHEVLRTNSYHAQKVIVSFFGLIGI